MTEHVGVDAKVSVAPNRLQRRVRVHVETGRVGDVKDFPTAFQAGVLRDVPGLVETGVDAEETVPAESIAGAGLAGDGISDWARGGNFDACCQRSGVGEGLWTLTRDKVPVHGYFTRHDKEALVGPRGDPACADLTSEWQTAGKPHESGHLPTAYDRIEHFVIRGRESASFAEG